MPSYDEGALVLFGRRKAASWSCCPWLEKQWHNDIDPEYGVGMGDYFEGFVDEEARALGLTHDAIRAWTPYSARLGESRPHGPSPRIQPTLGKLVRLSLLRKGSSEAGSAASSLCSTRPSKSSTDPCRAAARVAVARRPGCEYHVITMTVKTRIVRIGNSQGIRVPRTLLEEAQLPEDVELHAEPGRLVVRAARGPRFGWADAARAMRARDDDRLLDEPAGTSFDTDEWTW